LVGKLIVNLRSPQIYCLVIQGGPKTGTLLYALTPSNIDRLSNISLCESGEHL